MVDIRIAACLYKHLAEDHTGQFCILSSHQEYGTGSIVRRSINYTHSNSSFHPGLRLLTLARLVRFSGESSLSLQVSAASVLGTSPSGRGISPLPHIRVEQNFAFFPASSCCQRSMLAMENRLSLWLGRSLSGELEATYSSK